jgi:hypothetical protein
MNESLSFYNYSEEEPSPEILKCFYIGDTGCKDINLIMFMSNNLTFSNLIMQRGDPNCANIIYTIYYPKPNNWYSKPVNNVTGVLDIYDDGPALINATVNYSDGEQKSGGIFYFQIYESVIVTNQFTGKITVVQIAKE